MWLAHRALCCAYTGGSGWLQVSVLLLASQPAQPTPYSPPGPLLPRSRPVGIHPAVSGEGTKKAGCAHGGKAKERLSGTSSPLKRRFYHLLCVLCAQKCSASVLTRNVQCGTVPQTLASNLLCNTATLSYGTKYLLYFLLLAPCPAWQQNPILLAQQWSSPDPR